MTWTQILQLFKIWCGLFVVKRILVVAFFILTVCLVRSPYEFLFVQQSNDTCLAFTLAAVCNMLSEIGVSSTSGILGSSFSPSTSIGISLSVQQQLFVLLRGSLKRAESLKLKRLVTSNHLAKAKFDLTVRIGVAIRIFTLQAFYSMYVFPWIW